MMNEYLGNLKFKNKTNEISNKQIFFKNNDSKID